MYEEITAFVYIINQLCGSFTIKLNENAFTTYLRAIKWHEQLSADTLLVAIRINTSDEIYFTIASLLLIKAHEVLENINIKHHNWTVRINHSSVLTT